MPMPSHYLLLIKIQTGLTFLELAYPGYPGKETVKWVPVLQHHLHIAPGGIEAYS